MEDKISKIVSCHQYHHIRESYIKEDFLYAKKKSIENPEIADVTIPIQFGPLISLEQFDIWMYESLKQRNKK